MLRIEKVNEHNKQRMINLLRSDVIRHVFAFYDIQHDPNHTTTYVALENATPKGYILVYTAIDVPSVVLECENDAAGALLQFAPQDHCIIHAAPNLLPAIKRKFPDKKHYIENWMLIRKGEANFFRSELVRQLCTEEDASSLANLLLSREDRPKAALKRYIDWIRKSPLYGVFQAGELVSYAGSFLQMPEIWMIGGVYTNPQHRSKGYATLATSAITEIALRKAEAAALFVRSDNYPAIRVYEKIGYRKIGEKIWVDVGTGMRP
jgi:ribosomal protein S18 acetylase RimI-like enzyme